MGRRGHKHRPRWGIRAPEDSSKLAGSVCCVDNKGASASLTCNTVSLITLKENLQISLGINLIEISI